MFTRHPGFLLSAYIIYNIYVLLFFSTQPTRTQTPTYAKFTYLEPTTHTLLLQPIPCVFLMCFSMSFSSEKCERFSAQCRKKMELERGLGAKGVLPSMRRPKNQLLIMITHMKILS